MKLSTDRSFKYFCIKACLLSRSGLYPHHLETSQLIYSAYQLTGYHMMSPLSLSDSCSIFIQLKILFNFYNSASNSESVAPNLKCDLVEC